MTAHKYVTIWCDGNGCVDFVETEYHRANDARRLLRRSGWRRRNGRDLCPTCAVPGDPAGTAHEEETRDGH